MDMCNAVMKDRYDIDIEWYEKNGTNVYVQKKEVEEAYPGAFVKGRYQIYMGILEARGGKMWERWFRNWVLKTSGIWTTISLS